MSATVQMLWGERRGHGTFGAVQRLPKELPHVARYRLALHPERRRQHRQAEDVAIPRDRSVDVGHVQRGMGKTGDHENERSIPCTHRALSVLFQPASMPSLKSSHP